MMKEEFPSQPVPNIGPLTGAGTSISTKFEELVQRCAQLENENAVLAYKLRKMRRTIRRLGQDNAFIQRRLREHLKKREEMGVHPRTSPRRIQEPSESIRENSMTSSGMLTTVPLISSPTTTSNGHGGRTSAIARAETQKKNLKMSRIHYTEAKMNRDICDNR